MRFLLCGLVCCSPLLASYQLSNLLPGEAVDAYTDLTAFSFSVPHSLKRYGFSASPEYRYQSHSESGIETNVHSGGGPLFGYLQWDRLRLGLLTRNSGFSAATAPGEAQTDSKIMASYFFSFFSFGIEGGGFRSTRNEEGRWGGTGAVSLSFYGFSWGIDAVARIFRPNGSFAAPYPLPAAASRADYYPTGGELYSLRFKYEASFAWRSVLAVNVFFAPGADFYSLANTWRYRSGFLQLFSGLNYSLSRLRDSSIYYGVQRTDQLHLPLYLVLEHGRSIFYIGASTPIFYRIETVFSSAFRYAIRFQPRLAYAYRFRPNLWAGVSVASVNAELRGDSYDTGLRRELNLAFQVAYNLAPFGFDDEIPVPSNPFLAAR